MYLEVSIGPKFAEFCHSFLIRDPEKAIYSYYKGIQSEGGEAVIKLDPSEMGLFYSKMYKLYNFLKEKKGRNPVVVDAIDLQMHPEKTMKSYCEAVGIQFDPNMMTWETGRFVPRYKIWTLKGRWHSTVTQSTGFIKINPGEQKPVPINDLPTQFQKCVEDSRFYYEELRKACLKPR